LPGQIPEVLERVWGAKGNDPDKGFGFAFLLKLSHEREETK